MRRVLPLLMLAAALGCAGGLGSFGGGPLRLSELDGAGDPTRRASLQLCLEGLDADAAGRPRSASVYYERAIQVDATNPYAYLALARYEVENGDPGRALGYVDRTEQLLGAEGARSPGVDVHLAGLRGAALAASGRDGTYYLVEAERRAPTVWGDGKLSASELR